VHEELTLPMNTSKASQFAYVGLAGDRNPLGAPGAALLAALLSMKTGLTAERIGTMRTPLNAGWSVELTAAKAELLLLADALSNAFDCGRPTLTTMGRCAAGLATLPVVARHHPDALVVWFDAHADCNVPDSSTSGYLGGMVLSGASGLWESGLGSGLRLENVVLVGTRDLDPYEQELIADGRLVHIAPGHGLAEKLGDAVAGRPIYIHLDCDVLEPGIVPTEYEVPGGLSLAELRSAFEVLTTGPILGVEIAELQDRWSNGNRPKIEPLLEALGPLIDRESSLRT
jgi:arginase family enzyme